MLGLQGLRWDGGYAQVLDLGPNDPGPVVASFTLVTGEVPGIGSPAELDARYYPQDPLESDLGLREISVPGPLGDYPAWVGTPAIVPGQDVSDTWAIVVHGNSLSAADGLRMVPILTGAGYPTLVATYRNDPGAPADPSGKLRYGLTEWEDLEAMVRYALDEGSDGVVLDGYSMGGARDHGLPAALGARGPGASRDPGRADARLLRDRGRQRLARGDRAGRSASVIAHRRGEVDRGEAVRRGLGRAELPGRHRRVRRHAVPGVPRDGGHHRADRHQPRVRGAAPGAGAADRGATAPSTSRAGTPTPTRTTRRSARSSARTSRRPGARWGGSPRRPRSCPRSAT